MTTLSQPHITSAVPEDEDEEDEQGKEDGHVVHRLQHDEQLTPQVREESDQLQDPQQAKRPQNGEARAAFAVLAKLRFV